MCEGSLTGATYSGILTSPTIRVSRGGSPSRVTWIWLRSGWKTSSLPCISQGTSVRSTRAFSKCEFLGCVCSGSFTICSMLTPSQARLTGVCSACTNRRASNIPLTISTGSTRVTTFRTGYVFHLTQSRLRVDGVNIDHVQKMAGMAGPLTWIYSGRFDRTLHD